MRKLLLLSLLCLVSVVAYGQKRCVKGIPCGGSCIAAGKTCRTGSATAAAVTRASVAADSVNRDTAAKPWLASKVGKVYYKADCAAAKKIVVGNRIYFKTEDEAKKAGLTRSTTKGC